jgi:hypothetical protein
MTGMEERLAGISLRGLRVQNWFTGHVAISWEEGGKLHVQTSLAFSNR